jgi:hypothetical protein
VNIGAEHNNECNIAPCTEACVDTNNTVSSDICNDNVRIIIIINVIIVNIKLLNTDLNNNKNNYTYSKHCYYCCNK